MLNVATPGLVGAANESWLMNSEIVFFLRTALHQTHQLLQEQHSATNHGQP